MKNKKVFVLIVSSLMIIISFSVLLNYNTNTVIKNFNNDNIVSDGTFSVNEGWVGFKGYNTTIDTKTITLPNVNLTQAFPSSFNQTITRTNVILSTHNKYNTPVLFYINTTHYLVVQFINNNTVMPLHYWKYYNYSTLLLNVNDINPLDFINQNGTVIALWGASLNRITTTGYEYVYTEYYYLNNNTYGYFNTTLVDNSNGGLHHGFDIKPISNGNWIWVTNNSYTGFTLDYTPFTVYNIYSKDYYNVSFYNSLHNTSESLFSENSLESIYGYNEVTAFETNGTSLYITDVFYNVSSHNFSFKSILWNLGYSVGGGDNNAPFYYRYLSNGTAEIYGMNRLQSSSPYQYYNVAYYEKPNTLNGLNYSVNNTHLIYSSTTNYITLTEEGSGTVYSQSGLSPAGQNTQSLMFANLNNKTAYESTNSSFNILYNKSIVASGFYTEYDGFSTISNSGNINFFQPYTSSNKIIIYWLPIYTVTIKENGLSNINFTYTLNGTTYTQTTQEKNYTFPNGNYSLSVNAVTGYNVNYPTTIKVNGSNVIAYVNFTKNTYIQFNIKRKWITFRDFIYLYF